MAKRETKAERGRRLLWGTADDLVNDPDISARAQELREEERRAAASRRRALDSRADFSEVTGSSSAVEGTRRESTNSYSAMGSALASLFQSQGAGTQRMEEDAMQQKAEFVARQEQLPWYRKDINYALTGTAPQDYTQATGQLIRWLSGNSDLTAKELGDKWNSRSGENQQLVADHKARAYQQLDPVSATVEDLGIDLVGSLPSIVPSLLGRAAPAATGAVLAGTTAGAYNDAYNANIPVEQREDYALRQGMYEAAPELLVGRGLARLGDAFFGKKILGRAAAIAAKTAGMGFAEGTEEVTTSQLGLLDAVVRKNTGQTEEEVEFAKSQLPKDVEEWFTTSVARPFILGSVVGAPVGGVQSSLQQAAESGRVAARNNLRGLQALDEQAKVLADRGILGVDMETGEVIREPDPNQEMFDTPSGLPTQEEYNAARQKELEQDAAFRLRDKQRAREPDTSARDSVRVSIENRVDTARAEVETLRDRVEGGDTSQATLSTIAAAQRRLAAAENDLSAFNANNETGVTESQPQQDTRVLPPTQGEEQLTLPLTDGLDSYRAEAGKALEAQRASQFKKAKSTHQANRRKFVAETLASVPQNYSTQEKQEHLATALADWDAANRAPTIDNFTPVSETPKAAPGKRKRSTAPATPVAATSSTVNSMLAGLGVSPTVVAAAEQETANEVVPTREELLKQTEDSGGMAEVTTPMDNAADVVSVFGAIADKADTKNARVLDRLLTNGNLRIVASDAMLPENAQKIGAGGWYDGKTTYVVADKIDKNNIMGELLSIASHETKHAADLSDTSHLKGAIRNIIGDKANDNIVARIEALAKSGNAQAKAAVERARNAPEANYSYEVPAYFINEMRAARDQKGPAGRILGDLLGAVRVNTLGRFGTDKINLNDMAYLSDKLLTEVAEGGKNLEANKQVNDGLAMIVGEKHPRFKEFLDAGKVYTDVDGKRKFVLSDYDMKMADNAKRAMDRLAKDQEVLASDVVDSHVFDAYPDLRNMLVRVNPEQKQGEAAYYEPRSRLEPGYITLSPKDVKGWQSGTVSSGNILDSMVHEIQHAVQGVEGHARGGHTSSFVTKDDQKILNAHNKAVKAIESFVQNAAMFADNSAAYGDNGTDVAYLARSLQTTGGPVFSAENQGLWFQMMRQLDSAGTKSAKAEAKAIRDAFQTIHDNKDVVKQIDANAIDSYVDLRGEQEAYFTEKMRRVKQEDLNPFPHKKGEGSFFAETNPALPDRAIDRGETLVRSSPFRQTAQRVSTVGLAFIPDAGVKAINKITESRTKTNPDITSFVRATAAAMARHGGLGHDLHELLEDRDGYAAINAELGQSALTNGTAGLKAYARKKGISFGDARTELEETLDFIGKHGTTPADRQAMLNKLVAQHPELAPVRNSIERIAANTTALVRQKLVNNPNLTVREIKELHKLLDNRFKYATRVYAAFQGKEGAAHNIKLYREAREAAKLRAAGKTPGAKLLESERIWTAAKLDILNSMVEIPTDLDNITQERADKLYEMWMGDVRRFKEIAADTAVNLGMTEENAKVYAQEQVKEALENYRKSPDYTTVRKEANAQTIMEQMLHIGGAKGNFGDYYRGIKNDTSILEERVFLTPAVRELLGEIKDPLVRLALTEAKQGELIASNRMLISMRDKGLGTWVQKTEEANADPNNKFTVELRGEGYGALEGYSTTPEIAAAIQDNMNFTSALTDTMFMGVVSSQAMENKGIEAVAKTVTGSAKVSKFMSIVVDPVNAGLNLAGSPLYLLANGVYNPRYWGSASKIAVEDVYNALTDSLGNISQDLQDMIRYGVLDSARVQEIRRTANSHVKEMISATNPVSKTGKKAKRWASAGVETYAMMDAWVKIAAFKDRVATLEKYYAANGETKTGAEIKREAASTIKDTNVSYTRTPAVLRAAESLGITTFASYFYNVPVNLVMNGVVGMQDMVRAVKANNPNAAAIMAFSGAKRLSGLGIALHVAINGLNALADGGDGEEEDDKIAAMKNLLFDDAQFGASSYVGKDDKGNPLFFRWSRIDPFGPATDPIRAVLSEDVSPAQKEEFLKNYLQDLIIRSRGVMGVTRVGMAVMTDEPVKDRQSKLERIPGVGRIIDELTRKSREWGMEYDTAQAIVSWADTMMPGVIDAFDKNNPRVPFGEAEVADNWEGAATGFMASVVSSAGGRLDVANPEMAMNTRASALKKTRDEAKAVIRKESTNGSSPLDVIDAAVFYAEKERQAAAAVYDAYYGAKHGIGMPPKELSDLTEGTYGALQKTDISMLKRGIDPRESSNWLVDNSKVLNRDSITQAFKREAGRDKASQQEAKEKAEELIRTLEDSGLKVTKGGRKN